jgi:drug/metabolite transporter (DMT)-like permease
MQSGVAAIFLSAFAFSVMTLFVKLAGERIPSQEIVLARSLVSAVISYGLLRRANVPPWGNDRPGLWLRGLTGFAALSCVYAAVTHLPLAEATVIQYLNPTFTALLAGVFLGESISRATFGATLLCLAGVVLVARPEAIFGAGSDSLDPFWVAVAVLGAFGSACAYVVVRRLARTEHPLVIVFYFPLVNIPAALPFVARDFVWPVGIDWLWLLGVGLATQVGQMSLTYGLVALPASQATSLSYLQVVFAALFGIAVFGDWPDLPNLAGAGLVIAGSIWAARATRTSGP